MFLDKLWLRIKGELLTLKEDISESGDLRERAERLLQRMEERLNRSGVMPSRESGIAHRSSGLPGKGELDSDHPGSETRHFEDAESPELSTFPEIEREWEELMRRRKQKPASGQEEESPPPNPRTLG